jgi:hypothetical protein
MILKWGFICRSVQNYMEDFARHWRDNDIHIWKNDPGYTSIEYTFASPHFNSATNMYDLTDRAVALKAVFDGAMILATQPDGRFEPFELECIVEVATDKRNDRPSDGNVLVEPFDRWIPPVIAPKKVIASKNYEPEDMIFQARFDPIAKGMLLHLGHNGPDFRTLYSLLDWMETEGWTEEQVAAVSGQATSVVKDFTHTANNETILGPLARHGNKRWAAPTTPMKHIEAQRLILPAAKRFLETRAREFENTGVWPKYVKLPKAPKSKRATRPKV